MVLEFIKNNIWLVAAAIVSGGYLVWPWFAKRLSGAQEVGPLEAVQLINRKDALVLDVREQGEFNGGHIANAKNIPAGALEKRVEDLAKFKSKPLVIACANGGRSHAACATLKKLGFENVYVLSGGVGAWQQANLPVEKS
ncbi:MAG: rhodanese-like domain-containing protein [Burkholderiales bacterium]